MAGDELEFVEWLRDRRSAGKPAGRYPSVTIGIGDDMAVLRTAGETLLVSSDMLLDQVHFDTTRHTLERIGRKAIACSLSDCAAMAVRPLAVTVSLALPRDMTIEKVKELFNGMFTIADEHDLAIVGGDTTRWGHPLVIDVAITAECYEGIEPVTRLGAEPGDGLYVTGPLGGSLFGRHLDFTPRVSDARLLAKHLRHRLHAMIDISDGLALDLWRMCRVSKVGAMLDEDRLETVISDDARRASADDGPDSPGPLERMLSDGEDFELLAAITGEVTDIPVTLLRIGEITSGGFEMRRLDGRVEPLEPKGYVH